MAEAAAASGESACRSQAATSVVALLRHMLGGPEWPTCRVHRLLCDVSFVAACAPMIGASDLPFRLLARAYGATVAYSQMYMAHDLADPSSPWPVATCGADSPLILQLAGRDPPTFVAAARAAVARCGASLVGIDINLGCPQSAAQEGGYGAYMTDERDWHVVAAIIRALVESDAGLPITAKIRLQPTRERTLSFVCMLQSAGVAAVCVHARLRGTPKSRRSGAADLDALAALRACPAVCIPIIANGNVRCHADVHSVVLHTGCDGVMSAEALLTNPSLFSCAHAACTHASAPATMSACGCSAAYTASTATVRCHCEHVPRVAPAPSPLPSLQAPPHVLRVMHELHAPIPAHATLAHGLILHYLSLLRLHTDVSYMDAAAHIAWMLGRVGRGRGCGEMLVHAGEESPAALRAALVLTHTRARQECITAAEIDALAALVSRIFDMKDGDAVTE